ncbi:type IX secretion system plug protein [Mucilaginibacter polytrichastri]|uniref:Type 9 secretion system plug protein N-terminal domain-containing protein n=1 Tax=Mucilaginibacter polytrichastri TaxID=1302689 RepID=A0A1Q5ZU92_9SPHI|nr:DUF5103 domain-containing protein [Mucilaginibacter polytrichastri]OKS85327.1 hypothetical protein RG47T_0771 [Mucilaginibacter polytrichastri]
MFVILFFCLLFFVQKSRAQIIYDNRVYRPNIKTVEFCNTIKEGAFPIISLNSNDQLLLGFDELGSNTRTYNYTVEHCDAEWNPSRISPTEYLQSFNEDRIMDYRYSVSTIQKYVHYELKLPNRNIAPKIPGNYLLKVYENGDANNPIITRRFYVVSPRANVAAQIIPSNDVALRQTNQKINLQVNFNGMVVQNPYGDIRIVIMQNGRSETALLNTRPTFIRGASLEYSDLNINDFAGGNEYRHVDTRSLRLNSEHTARIFRDTANAVLLLADRSRDQDNYLSVYDNNGGFYVRNQEGSDPVVDADYAQVYFNIGIPGSTVDNTVYVVGKFNDYVLDQRSKMNFDAAKGRYFFNTLLKQGIVDYQYVLVDKAGKPDYTTLEGNHFETENDYQVLVYYRQPGARWEELVGYLLLNTTKR